MIAAAQAAARTEARRLLAGIGITLLGVFVFACTNAMAKWLGTTYPVGEVLFARSVTVLLLLAPFITRADFAAMRAGGRPWLHLARCLLSAIEVVAFYWAINDLPLAGGTTIYLAAPIYVTGLSALFLGEQVGWRRWLAVLTGFAGVLVALQPSGLAPTPHALVAVAGSFMYAISLVMTRRLRGTPTTLLVASQVVPLLLITAATAAPVGPLGGWVMPTALDALVMALVGALSMVGYLCVNRGIQMAPASVITPFHYASIVWATVLGWLVFAEIPTPAMLLGAAIIVGAGLFIVLREHRLGRGDASPPRP